MRDQAKHSLGALVFFLLMTALGIAATFGGYRLGVATRRFDGAANTIVGVGMIGIGLIEARRHGSVLLRLRRT